MLSDLVIYIVLSAIVYYVAKSYIMPRWKDKYSLPPGPRRLPLLGNLFDLPKSRDYYHWATHNKLYGILFGLCQNIIILNDRRIAEELLEKRSSTFSDRPKSTFLGKLCGWNDGLSLLNNDDQFRAYRKSIAQFMGSKSTFLSFQPLQETEARHFVRNILDEPNELRRHIRSEVGTVVLRILYGYSAERGAKDPLVDLANDAMAQFSIAMRPGIWLVDIIPALQYLPDWMPGTKFKRLAREWHKTLTNMVHVPIKFVRKKLEAGNAQSSYVTHSYEKISSPEDEHMVQWTAFSLYSGGSDTLVAVLYGFYLAMTLHPEVLKKAHDEIDTVIGNDALPTFADRERLPYINAMVKEIIRWNTIGPMGLPHVGSKDDIYEGYLIPKGSMLFANIWFFHHDPQTYHEPNLFKPERFLGIDGQESEPDPHFTVFGFGRRICPGKDLADSILWITIAMSVALLNITKARDEYGKEITPVADWSDGVIIHPKDFKCTITARSPKAEALIRLMDHDFEASRNDAEIIRQIMI